jgi:primosomal protein N' (replication factor Y)
MNASKGYVQGHLFETGEKKTSPLLVAKVAVESGLDKLLDYEIPPEQISSAHIGQWVEVPFRNHIEIGVICELLESAEHQGKLKRIARFIKEGESVPRELMNLAVWISRYYCCPLRRCIQVILPKALRQEKTSEGPLWVTRKITLEEMKNLAIQIRSKHPSRAAVLDVLLKVKSGILLSELLEKAKVSASPVQTLAKEKILSVEPMVNPHEESPHRYFSTAAKTLNKEQSEALAKINASLESAQFHTHLLWGITGSGKTEVYLQAIQKVLEGDGSALLMVPEVSLTPQTLDRIRARLQVPVAVLHYKLTPVQKQKHWKQILEGKARVIVGARSSVFCPCPNLKLIIVDEEHETSYKSEESPYYHARDVAIQRARSLGATLVLGSATPSLESFHKAQSGIYQLNRLQSRAGAASLPHSKLVDLRHEKEGSQDSHFFSRTLLEALHTCMEKGEQAMLFLNRRGYFAQTQCSHCGQNLSCPHCDISLTLHRHEAKLICHLCHYACSRPTFCPHCRMPADFKYKGWGTEHVQASIQHFVPTARVLRMDGDTTRHKGSMEKILRDFRTHKADILVGTQMIAKGHHFPGLTLVGVLNPDAQLLQPDFRSGEHLFQQLVQVFGRSGRGHLAGQVIVQTRQPEAKVYEFALHHDYESFATEELQARALFAYPPFVQLIKITVWADHEQEVLKRAKEVYDWICKRLPKRCLISSPGDGAWRKIQDQWRQVFLIKAPLQTSLGSLLSKCASELKIPSHHLHIDVDCLSSS